jgi:Fe-S cluster assembly ATP-binding protein
MLDVIELQTSVAGKPILSGLNLKVRAGEIHAVMGPNGAGKSTFAKVLAGDPSYEITGGQVLFEGKDIFTLSPEERAHLGLFVSFQYPVEIPGITNEQFLYAAYSVKLKALGQPPISEEAFSEILDEKMAFADIRSEFKTRNLNEGFSGGEKKRNEILQMAVLEPKLAILDETDSGLDIDAMRIVARGVNGLMRPDHALILITHYQRLLDYIRPDFVHVLMNGKIVQSGGHELALALEERGYDWLVKGSYV